MIRIAGLEAVSGISHAFFTRKGGISNGLYASLNCGYRSGDLAENVERNRAIAMQMIGVSADGLATCRQVHGTIAVTVDRPWQSENAPDADAMATNAPGLVLGILTADCAPVLFCDPAAGVIGAAHAGWRGALAGVIEAAVAAMEKLGAERRRVRAGIGPCIGSASYEVGPEFPQPFVASDPAVERFFVPARRSGHFMFDLGGYVEYRLIACGVSFVNRALCDTAADERQFFSFRRACLRGEPAFGLGLSAIVLDG